MGDVRHEWCQFRLLSRDSVRRLLASAVLSRESDPMPFAILVTTLVAAPPAMFAFAQLPRYAVLGRIDVPLPVIESLVMGHRMFFIVYAMTATALLAALLWETLLPDRVDQEIVSPLPVRPRTLAAARLAAAVLIALGFAGAIGVPSGVLFALSSSAHPLLGSWPVVFVSHTVATIAGCLFVFLALLVVRGLVAAALGARMADRLATALQLMAVVGLLEVLLYLPAVLPALVEHMRAGDAVAAWLPPVWFAALYSWMVVPESAVLFALAALGVAALMSVGIVVVPVYLVPAGLMARRALESQDRQGAGMWAAVVRDATALLVRAPVVRGIVLFALATLGRNRRHLLIVVSYAGAAAAVGSMGLITAGLRGGADLAQPAGYLLAMPLVLMFFLVLGVRAASAVPSDLHANWAFRLLPPTVTQARSAMRLTLVVLGIAPVVALALGAALLIGWPLSVAIRVAAFDVAAGLLLVECAITGWTRIPFTCAHVPEPDALRSKLATYAFPFVAFSVLGASLQMAALGSPYGTVVYLAFVAAAALFVRACSRQGETDLSVEFDLPEHGGLQVLGLSEASR
jgi:hypothetical protein